MRKCDERRCQLASKSLVATLFARKKALNKVLKSFDKALDASHGGVLLTDLRDDEEKENTEQEHGVGNERESKSKSFEKDKYFDSQIQKWESLSYGSYIKVGVLGSTHPLCLVGMPSGVLRYDVSKINKNMSKHASYLTVDLLKEIPNIIEHPIAITEFTEDSTVNVFGNVFANGHPMMVGVTISKDRAGNDISKIRTYNLRRDVEKIITDTNILYLSDDKKRTREWFQACGKQVPLGGSKFGFIRSISQKLQNINTDERNSKKSENRGVNWSDLEPDITVQAEDNSDVRVHPPAPKKKASKSTESDKAAKAEPKKEA